MQAADSRPQSGREYCCAVGASVGKTAVLASASPTCQPEETGHERAARERRRGAWGRMQSTRGDGECGGVVALNGGSSPGGDAV